MAEKPIYSKVQLEDRGYTCTLVENPSLGPLTSCPVQNMGQCCHGTSRALGSHVLRYGFRTMSGSTGGVRVDAVAYATIAKAAMYSCQGMITTDVALTGGAGV